MNRRRFLHLLTMAASAVAVSPYWTPTPELVEPLPPPPVYSGDPWVYESTVTRVAAIGPTR
jgi:hypothetical protein